MAKHNPRFVFLRAKNLYTLCCSSFGGEIIYSHKQKENELYHDNDYIQLPRTEKVLRDRQNNRVCFELI